MTAIKNYTYKNQSLDYVEIHNGNDLPTIVLMHGYGANMRDLAPLATLSPELKKYNWLFPDGPLKVPIGPMMYGKAWFPIDMEQLNAVMMSGGFEHLFSDHYPQGMDESAELLKNFIEDSVKGDLILGGFSQGSMMTCDLVFNYGVNVKAMALLSSTLVARARLEQSLNSNERNIPIFQSHGTDDMVLPISMARKLKTILEEHDLKVDYHEFPGGHEIPPRVLQALITFLGKSL